MSKYNIVYPDYDNCVLNLANSILKYYNVETKYNGLTSLDNILEKKFKNIVLIILDGMGSNLLKNISPSGFFSHNKLENITSVYPSTTTAALNTYYSGKPPIETGWIGWSQYFKEYGRTLDMFPRTDSYTEQKYPDAKIDVFDLLKYKTIFEQIEESSPNVKGYEINPVHCETRSNRCMKANTVKIMCEDIESICKNTDNNFIFAYYDAPDKILHRKGCSSQEVKDFVLESQDLIENLCQNLSGTNTLVLVSADHGHTDINSEYDMLNLTDINECLIMPPSLEPRALSFWVKENKKTQFEKVFNDTFKDEFILFTKKEFLDKHLLGYGTPHPKIDDFIGNYIAVSKADAVINLTTNISKEKYKKVSTHCGITENEMVVPLIAKPIN